MPEPSSLQFDLQSLQALGRLAQHGSIQGAAKALGTSRATIRRRLEQLEAAAGVALLYRDGIGTRLTQAGEVLVTRGDQLFGELDGLLSEAREAATEATGLVRIVVPVGMQLELVAATIGSLRASSLDIRIVLDERCDPAGADLADAELIFHFGPPPVQADWFSRVIRRTPVRLVASPAYLEELGTPRSVEELEGHRLLVWGGGGTTPDRLPLRDGGAHRALPWFLSPNIALLRRMAADGHGIAFAPDGGIPDEAGTGALVGVLDGVVGRDEALRASSPRPSRHDPRVREFVKRAQEMFMAFPEA